MDILDYTLTNHINFEADINFAVDSGVVQVGPLTRSWTSPSSSATTRLSPYVTLP